MTCAQLLVTCDLHTLASAMCATHTAKEMPILSVQEVVIPPQHRSQNTLAAFTNFTFSFDRFDYMQKNNLAKPNMIVS